MDMVTIKYEQRTCYGCLSTDRRTTPLGNMFEMFLILAPALTRDINIYICWECMSTLKKVHKFQKQLERVQEVLYHTYHTSFHTPFTTLTTSYKDYYDQEISYNHDSPKSSNKVELKEDSNSNSIKEENIDDSELNIKVSENETYDDICSDTYEVNSTSDVIPLDTIRSIPVDKKARKAFPNQAKASDSETRQKNWNKMKKEYKSYAIIVTNAKWKKPHSQYFTQVRLDESEMEKYFLINERKRKKDLPLQCSACSLTYSRQIDLDRHMNLNHLDPAGPYRCVHCGAAQASLPQLAAHWRSHSVFARCGLCGARVFPRARSLHLARCHLTKYRCSGCVRTFSSIARFSAHYNKNHPFICDYCNKKCALRSVLEKHIKNHHTSHMCAECERSFPSYRLYRSHCRDLHPALLYSVVRPEESYCVECDVQFVSVALYKRHVSAKHAHKPAVTRNKVPCPECSRSYPKYSSMMLHYNFAHVKVTDYRCDLCDKYFLKSFGLRTHMERVHLKLPSPKNKICDLCGRAFVGKSVLENHRRTHTGERPFQCDACPAAFAQKGAMKIHQRKQHNTD